MKQTKDGDNKKELNPSVEKRTIRRKTNGIERIQSYEESSETNLSSRLAVLQSSQDQREDNSTQVITGTIRITRRTKSLQETRKTLLYL